jgi:hypothetical protein
LGRVRYCAEDGGGGLAFGGWIFGGVDGVAEGGDGRGAVRGGLVYLDGLDAALDVWELEPGEDFVERFPRGFGEGERAAVLEEGVEEARPRVRVW